MKRLGFLLLTLLLGLGNGPASAFDHQHTAWDRLLHKHVRWINGGSASQVDYGGLQRDAALLEDYLNGLSRVSRAEFDGWNRERQLAFLINAYNGFTVELILTKYPDLSSIKDLGSFFKSPWKKRFFTLLGQERHLDEIEHDLIRAPGVYAEPRIHVAVVCASVGCPALRDEAFVAEKLDEQLEDSMRRFLSDRSRNRFNERSGSLEVSKIFDWYRDDFSKGHGGYFSLASVFAAYAPLLADNPSSQQLIRKKRAAIIFLDYDWSLNDTSG
jgi:hypothetical protein